MCYLIFLSTTSPEALDALPSPLYQFERTTEQEDEMLGALLQHPHRWYLTGQYGGCSCHFRHWDSGENLGFSPPADWFPEDADDIESTGAVYDVLTQIAASGHHLDLVDMWNGTDPADMRDLSVSLSAVSRNAFRFFENYRFSVSS